MIHLEIDDEALAEAIEARDFYAAQRLALGDDFAQALDVAMRRIMARLTAWPPFSHRTRRYLLSRFPCAVIYTSPGDTIRVPAVMHQHRRPATGRVARRPEHLLKTIQI